MFKGSFKAAKCKTQCRLCVSRIKLLRSKREIQLNQMRREIAGLLREGKDEHAWIRVEAVHREQNLTAGYEILELYLELVAVRAQLLEKAKEPPRDMVEALTSLMYAAPRVADLPELFDVRKIIATKFGKDLGVEGANATEPSTWEVNVNLRRYLAVDAPESETKLILLSKIAKEQGVDFNAEEYGRMIIMQEEQPVQWKPEPGEGPVHKQQDAAPMGFPGLSPQNTAPQPKELPEGWGRTFSDQPIPARSPYHDNDTPMESTFPVVQAPGSVPPPAKPNFKVPNAGSTKGPYTDAQEAAIAAYKAAEDAKKAAQDARRYADQVPKPGEPASSPGKEDGIDLEMDTEMDDGPPQYPPKPFAGKSQQELQEQYDAAPGPPEKEMEEASAPPADAHDLQLPDAPNGTSGGFNVDSLPGLDHLPGPPNSSKPPTDELDELNRRFEILKKR